jgi:limonene-1,2-epoxide hydrolase
MARKLLLRTLLVAIVFLPLTVRAAERTAAEKANLDAVTRFCESFATRDMAKITSFLSPEIVYRLTDSVPAVKGEAAIARIRAYVDRSTSIEFKILESWVRGSVVVNERVDSFTRADGNVAYHLTGVFLLKDGKVIEWSDYSIR